jgi:hypothetical protein
MMRDGMNGPKLVLDIRSSPGWRRERLFREPLEFQGGWAKTAVLWRRCEARPPLVQGAGQVVDSRPASR